MFWFEQFPWNSRLPLVNCLHSPSKANINRVICQNSAGPNICFPLFPSPVLTPSWLNPESQAQLFRVVFRSLLTEADTGHTKFTDEIFQNEMRFPGGDWKADAESYTDVVNVQHRHTSRPHMHRCAHVFKSLGTLGLKSENQSLSSHAPLLWVLPVHLWTWLVANFQSRTHRTIMIRICISSLL